MISDDEWLYRAIVDPKQWSRKKGQPRTSAFKNPKGASCELICGRSEAEIVNFLKKKLSREVFAIVKISRLKCDSLGLYPVKTSEDPQNPHAEIWGSKKCKLLSNEQALDWAENCELVYIKEDKA